MKKNKIIKLGKIEMTRFTFVISIITFLLFISNIVFLFFANTDATRSRLIFNILESVLMFGLILLPSIASKITHLSIPPIMEILYIVFCTGSIICGEIFDFYGLIHGWDSLLHTFSGVLFGILGFVIINTFNRVDGKDFKFSPLFVSFWVLCFGLAMGAIWEIIEYLCDEWLGTNMQQYMVSDSTLAAGEALVGHAALKDTMKDLMLDLAGCLMVSIIGYFELKKQKKGIATIYLETNKTKTEEKKEGNVI